MAIQHISGVTPITKPTAEIKPADEINGAKIGWSLTGAVEKRVVAWILPRIPMWINSRHLTFASIPICMGVVASSFAASRYDIRWLYIASILTALQWVTDALDGALGRLRNTGLIRWGYYVDHFLDFFFMSSVFLGYYLLAPSWMVMAAFILAMSQMMSAYLVVGASRKFQIAHYGVGPTEGRMVIIAANSAIIYWGAGLLTTILPWILGVGVIAIGAIAYGEQKELWQLDAEARERKD